MALGIKLTGASRNYLERLDRPTKERIIKKLQAIAENPMDFTLSKSLANTQKRATRVGDYRVLFTIDDSMLLVAEIGPRGQVYRTLSK